MDINMWAVVLCAVVAQGLGMLWYGPLFGKAYGMVVGGKTREQMTDEECKEMNKKMGPVYALNFVISIITIVVLACVLNQYMVMDTMEGIKVALLMWLGFVMPMCASGAMWSGKPKNIAINMFLITAGYQLVAFVLFAIIISLF